MYTVYTAENCIFCSKAKALLLEYNCEFVNVILDTPQKKSKFKETTGLKTVPQIYNHRDEHIGGYNELVEYMKKTLWLDKKKTSKPALPPTLDDIGANSE